jgi:hypothetical protein
MVSGMGGWMLLVAMCCALLGSWNGRELALQRNRSRR